MRVLTATVLFLTHVAIGSEGKVYLDNPTKLHPPVRLVSAQPYLGGGSVDGKLQDCDGWMFWFFLDQNGFEASTHGIYVFYAEKKRQRATFEEWKMADLCVPLKAAIRSQFTWDATTNA